MNKCKLLNLVLWVCFLVLLCQSAVSAAYISTIYENPQFGVSIRYPENWQLQENVMHTVSLFMAPLDDCNDLYRENVNILVQDLSGYQMTLDDYTKLSMEQLSKIMTDFNLEKLEAAVLDEQPAYRMVYTAKQGQLNLKLMQIWCIKNDYVYAVTFAAETLNYDRYYPVAERMINSFAITR